MKTLIAFLISVATNSTIARADANGDLIWKARGIQAVERAEEINLEVKKIIGVTGAKKRRKLECEFAKEQVYMAFAAKETEKIVSKKSSDSSSQWRVLLFQHDGDVQISLMFDPKTEKVKAWKVPTLTSGRQVSAFINSNLLMIIGSKCNFILDLDDPLNMIALLPDESK